MFKYKNIYYYCVLKCDFFRMKGIQIISRSLWMFSLLPVIFCLWEYFLSSLNYLHLSVLYKWRACNVNCVITHTFICIYLYCHGFSCWKFAVFGVFLQRKLFNNRTLPSSGRLRELLHCFNRRAGRWWPFTPTLASIIVTCNCTALKWELILWISLGGKCGFNMS